MDDENGNNWKSQTISPWVGARGTSEAEFLANKRQILTGLGFYPTAGSINTKGELQGVANQPLAGLVSPSAIYLISTPILHTNERYNYIWASFFINVQGITSLHNGALMGAGWSVRCVKEE